MLAGCPAGDQLHLQHTHSQALSQLHHLARLLAAQCSAGAGGLRCTCTCTPRHGIVTHVHRHMRCSPGTLEWTTGTPGPHAPAALVQHLYAPSSSAAAMAVASQPVGAPSRLPVQMPLRLRASSRGHGSGCGAVRAANRPLSCCGCGFGCGWLSNTCAAGCSCSCRNGASEWLPAPEEFLSGASCAAALSPAGLVGVAGVRLLLLNKGAKPGAPTRGSVIGSGPGPGTATDAGWPRFLSPLLLGLLGLLDRQSAWSAAPAAHTHTNGKPCTASPSQRVQLAHVSTEITS